MKSLIDDKVENIVILNDIQMLDTIAIDYNVMFTTPATGVSLVSTRNVKHFNVTGNNVTIEVQGNYGGRVFLDGDYIGGGIYTNAESLTLIHLGIFSCNGDGIEADGNVTLKGSTLIRDNLGYGVSASWVTITITDNTNMV